MNKQIINEIRQYISLQERDDLERATTRYFFNGAFIMDAKPMATKWMISVMTFLKWHYKTKSALVCSILAENDGILDDVMNIFKKECNKKS